MFKVSIRVCGDHWVNRDESLELLRSLPLSQPVVLDLHTEGASLKELGIVDDVLSTGRDPGTISITRWPNSVEPVPFPVLEQHDLSHFFWMSRVYRHDPIPDTHQYRYGMFVGRRTVARCAMLYDAWHQLRDQCLFSVMNTVTPLPWHYARPGRDLEHLQDWIDHNRFNEFDHWWKNCPVDSIDNHSVRDQYDPNQNTNADLLAHYHRFDIEIVMESYTLGDCFFPTEKTIRPLSARRALLVYGPRNFLKRLRDLGFQTWNQQWDESYDDLQGPDRWQAIMELAKTNLVPDPAVARHNWSRLEQLR